MSIVKIHKMSTWFATFGAFIGCMLFFLSEVDRQYYLNLVPQSIEDFVSVVALLVGILTVLSLVVSVVLSLYRIAEKS